MVLKLNGLVLAGLLIIALGCIETPVMAADHTLNPGDSIQENITSAIAGDTIILNPGTYNQHDIFIDKSIIIRANTSIGGNPVNTIIDATNSGRIFDIYTGRSLAIDNLTLQNGQASYGGGAISSYYGTLTITTTSFFNCSASYRAGAIDSYESTLSIASSTFSNCSAIHNGGAIYSVGGTGIISSSTFSKCSASDRGGAIFSIGTTINVISSVFSNCSVIIDDGETTSPLGSTVPAATIVIRTTIVPTENKGGAIYATGGSPVNVISSTFSNCLATYGGAIYTDAYTTNITSSTFSNCSASGGGAVYSNYGTLIITSSTISDCLASLGGGIYSDYGGTVSITFSSFANCSATNEGGAINAYRSDITITSSTFSNCSATNNGGVVIATGTTIITSSSFSNSSAGSFGGAICVGPGTISSSTFSNCSAGYGGAIYSGGGLMITSSTITDCSATNGGAILSGGISITNSTIVNCSASGSGGAIWSFGSATINSTSITNCSASGSGGAIYNNGGTITLLFSRIYNNTGTAVFNSGGIVNASNNWWGTNNDPSGFTFGGVTVSPWLVLGIAATPSSITTAQTSAIRTNLTYNSDGTDTSGGGIFLPDDILNTFSVTAGSGSILPLTDGTVNGVAETSFTSSDAGTSTISATVDDQTVSVTIPVASPPPPMLTTIPTAIPTYSEYQSSGNDDGPPAVISPMIVTVNIGGNSGAGKATVTGTKLLELIVTGTVQFGSGTTFPAPPGIVYQYINLEPARFGTITKTVINFSVPQSWLDEHHIAPGSIVLYHQTVNGWEALPTTVLYTKDGTVYFSAQTTGFSLFAITGTPSATTPVTTVKTTASVSGPVPEQTPVQVTTIREPVTTQTTAPPATPAPPSAAFPIMDIILVIAAVVVLGAGGFLVRRWWIRQ